MTSQIVTLIASFFSFLWRLVSNPVLIGLITITALAILILSGISFGFAYSGILLSLAVFGILSIWIPGLRSFFSSILIIGALFYLGNTIILKTILPSVDNFIAETFPSYKEWKTTSKEFTDTKIAERSISMKKGMIGSEVVKGTFGTILEKTATYDDNGNIIEGLTLQKNQKMMSLGLEKKNQMKNSEGMVYVLVANENGDFVKSISALVPIRKVRWDSEVAQKKPEPEKLEEPPRGKISVDQKNSTTLNSKVEMKLVRNEGNRYYPITQLTRTKERISIQCAYGLILRGSGFGDNEYVGKWTQGNISGPFTLKFIDVNNNARGTLGETTGDIQIVIQQI